MYDLMEIRGAIDTNLRAAGLPTATWSNAEVVAGKDVPIRAVHFTDMRARIQDLWTAASMGAVPQFTAGAIIASTRVISARDPSDLRTWLTQYENSTWAQTRRARTYHIYDGYDGVSQFGKGRRTELWDSSGRSLFTYDKAGRQTKEQRRIDGHEYLFQWSFDALDRVYQQTFPDGEVLTHSYGVHGLLTQLQSSLGPTYLSGVQYNALNLPTSANLAGDGTYQMRHTYYGPDAAGYPYGAVRTIELQKGALTPMLVQRTLTYDPVGNPLSIQDQSNGSPGETISYTYDDLDRLLTASAPLNETYAYNPIGNITSKNGLAMSYGDAAHKHAVTAYNGVSYGYDANGNMVTRGGQEIKYNPENRPVRVKSGGATISRFAYDGDGVRRKRLDSNGTIHYVGPYERNVGNAVSPCH